MARLTLRLPDSLHRELAEQADAEGVSLNQYIVFSLTRVGTVARLATERAEFGRLLGAAPPEEAEASLQTLLSLREGEGG